MIYIKINGPLLIYESDVDSTDVVDPILGTYPVVVDDWEESRYYEPAFIIGDAIPLNRGKTFAECGIKPGDTLHRLLGMKKKHILIPNELAIEDQGSPSHSDASIRGNTVPVRKNKIHIEVTDAECKRWRVPVYPNSVVDSILGKYAATLKKPAESCYYEPIFMIGEDLSVFLPGEKETFAQRGIKEGATLYLLRRDRRSIVIQNEFESGQKTALFCAIRVPISCVKEWLQQNEETRVNCLPTRDLALKFGDILLDESKTLDDYEIGRDRTICLCLKLQFSIGVPKYTKMEQVMFEPGDKMEQVRNEVKRKLPDFAYAGKVRESCPVPLRGMFSICEKGTTVCIYLDIFRDKMEMFVAEYSKRGLVQAFGCFISSESTLDDVCRLIKRQFKPSELMTGHRLRRWPQNYAFDCTWMRTFAPQIEDTTLSSSTAMPLFFFPLCVDVVRSVKACPPAILDKEFTSMFCKEELGLEGMERLIYHPRSDEFLTGFLRPHLDKLWSDGEPYSVLLIKPYVRILRGRRIGATEYNIRVNVQWGNRCAQFQVKPADTLNILKDEIERRIQVPSSMQMLTLNGVPLESNGTFAEMGITDRSKLDLIPVME